MNRDLEKCVKPILDRYLKENRIALHPDQYRFLIRRIVAQLEVDMVNTIEDDLKIRFGM